MLRIAYLESPYFLIDLTHRLLPETKGRPLLLHRQGVVVASSPELSGYKLMGQPLAVAAGCCPEANLTLYEPELYEKARRCLLDAVAEISPSVEPLKEGACFFDLSGLPLEKSIKQLKGRLKELDIGPVFLGIAGSKPVSYLAARHLMERLKSPSGFNVSEIRYGDEEDFLRPLPLSWDPFLPAAPRERLCDLGFTSFGQLQEVGLQELSYLLGDLAWDVYLHSRGRSDSPVLGLYPPGQISCRFGGEDETSDYLVLMRWIREGAKALSARLKRERKGCRRLCLALEQGNEVMQEERVLPAGCAEERTLREVFLILLSGMFLKKPVNRLTMTVSSLYDLEFVEQDLFALSPKKGPDLESIVEGLRERYPRTLISGLTADRREAVLANWDPWRFVDGGGGSGERVRSSP